jgi:hypothetical protein
VKRSGPPQRKAPLKRKPFRRRPKSLSDHNVRLALNDDPNDPEIIFREDVHRRSRHRCERCGRPSAQIHHRRTRQVRWSRWLPENGFDACRHCHHDIIHAHPEWAMRHGLILSQHGHDHPAPAPNCPLDCPIDHIGVCH